MKAVQIAALVAALSLAGAAFAADTTTQKTDPSKMSPQSSHPGVEGDAGSKNGPAAKPSDGSASTTTGGAASGASTGTAGSASSSTTNSAPAGTNVPQASPGSDPTHDASGIKGAPGNKNGPAQKQPSGQ